MATNRTEVRGAAPQAILRRLRRFNVFLFATIIFALAHTQSPLYYSNQHQYFLHGLAKAGLGNLQEDWLANTRDPTPVFSAVVEFTHRHLRDEAFYVYYAIIFGIYCFTLLSLFDFLAPNASFVMRLVFFTVLVAIHAAVARWASVEYLDRDFPWYLQSGVAGQYVLGPGLQPSVFGVLLVSSIVAFVRRRPYLAVLLADLAAIMHSTYLLIAALVTLAYLILLIRERRFQIAIIAGLCSLWAVLPIVYYDWRNFGPSSAQEFEQAQTIVATIRIPHHAQVERWLDKTAAGQLIWIVAAWCWTWRTRLFPILSLLILFALALSLIQILTGSLTLALLFPWRMSAVLMPIATTVIVARLLSFLDSRLHTAPLSARVLTGGICCAALAGLVIGGWTISRKGLSYRVNSAEDGLLNFVHDHKQPGDIYLLPISIPKVGTGEKGSVSTSFTPPPRPSPGSNLIPVDLQRFRLSTGAPIFIDFKSIPYQDREVWEWYTRLQIIHKLYEESRWDSRETRETLARHRITHVVTTAKQEIHSPHYELCYSDSQYRLYKVR
ncbi:MAG TPA: DUF6798 domain-containing protein [Gemmataceae bacterium]|nr:DUF6798 domain-containing protein [Gemmataceae bacterium]